MDLAPPASAAEVRAGDPGGSLLVLFQAPFGAKRDADAAGLAPGFKYVDFVLLGRIL